MQASLDANLHLSQSTFESPLPPAAELEHLEQLHPGVIATLIQTFTEEARHRREMELADQKQQHWMLRQESVRATHGLYLGFVITIAAFSLTLWLGLTDHDVLAGAFGIADLIGLVSVFVFGSRRRKEKATPEDSPDQEQ